MNMNKSKYLMLLFIDQIVHVYVFCKIISIFFRFPSIIRQETVIPFGSTDNTPPGWLSEFCPSPAHQLISRHPQVLSTFISLRFENRRLGVRVSGDPTVADVLCSVSTCML